MVQRRILEYSGVPHKIIDIPLGDRSLVWKLSRERYYAVPLVKDGSTVVFETGDNTQVIAKYLDEKLELDLFPWEWEGVQSLLWRHIENDIEGCGFKLNDIYYREFVPAADQLDFLRFKERKFGRNCLALWRKNQKQLLADLEERLLPCDEMLRGKDYLLCDRPLFVDFDLCGILDNYLFSGHHRIPARLKRLRKWHDRMRSLKRATA